MAKEKLTPAIKSVPTSGGVKDGGNSIVTTPKQDTGGKIWSSKGSSGKIMK